MGAVGDRPVAPWPRCGRDACADDSDSASVVLLPVTCGCVVAVECLTPAERAAALRDFQWGLLVGTLVFAPLAVLVVSMGILLTQ